MNLLIVDDEVAAVKGILNGIDWEKCGIKEIWTAYNADNALKIIKDQKIDIMLCDIEMPGANGIELLRRIRKDNKDIACTFLTCHAKFEYAQEAIALGCKGYILKPAPYEEICNKINEVRIALEKDRKTETFSKFHISESEIEDARAGKENRSAKEIVGEVEELIHNNISNSEFMVSDIADKMFLNRDYVNRVFKKEKGISIIQYLIQERMNLAALLLEDGKVDVNQAAQKAGYNNYPYFASSFKKYYGCSPSQYQKEKS